MTGHSDMRSHVPPLPARSAPLEGDGRLFTLWTMQGLAVGVGDDDTLRADPSGAGAPVVLVRSSGNSRTGFMLREPCGRRFRITGGAFVEAVHPWRLRDCEAGVALYEPVYGQSLAAGLAGDMFLQPIGQRGDPHAFVLRAVSPLDVSGATAARAGETARLMPADLNGPDMLDLIARALTPRTAAVMQAIIRLLPPDQLQWLGTTLLGLPDHIARVADAFPDDIWAHEGLPTLREWIVRRAPATTARAARHLDALAVSGIDGRPTSAGHAINAAARAGVPPRRKVCVVATARNEGLYLLEWIAHHRSVGADAIFVYSNDNTDGSDDLLRALALAGEITWIESELNEGTAAQPKAYGHAFGLLPQVLEYRWSLVIDLDEFFGFDTGRFRSLPDYLDWQETRPVDAVALNWLVFGSGGATDWADAPLAERFTMRLPWIDAHVKCISRPSRCVHSRPHHPSFDPSHPAVVRDSTGAIHQWDGDVSISASPRADHAWIAHYFLKSTHEFLWKFSRNRGNHGVVRETGAARISEEFAALFVRQHGAMTMMHDDRMRHCAPGTRAAIARLSALPGVAAAERIARARYRAGVQAIINDASAGTDEASATYQALIGLCSSA